MSFSTAENRPSEEGPDNQYRQVRDGNDRLRLVQAAVKDWTDELVDLSGRNTLLYYRDLKQGTLDLSMESNADDVAVEALLGSRTVRLSTIFEEATLRPAARRARTIRAKATENYEERGLDTLFLAWGMATWSNPRTMATPAAPVLLREAHLAPRGGAAEDFDCSLTGEWEINPTLLHLLRNEYQVDIDAEHLLSQLDDATDPPKADSLFEHLSKEGSGVPGFLITPRVVMGNFSYAKLPMVQDLERATQTLLDSELVCAIAGDETAAEAIRNRHPNVRENDPDFTPPADEFLIRDADASQSYAINAAVGSADLVIDGPPGTGKSQTIANLIASLSARGRRVLFVAEKRAAIDAVLSRLKGAGLGDLVLDLHGGTGSKRALAQSLAKTLADIASVPRPVMEEAHESLAARRDTLVERAAAIHEPREPWGLSIYDVQAKLLDIPADSHSSLRLRGDVLRRMDGPTFRTARSQLESFTSLGGLTLSKATSPWAEAFRAGVITSSQDVESVFVAASMLAEQTLPSTAERLDAVLAESGLRAPSDLQTWAALLALLEAVNATLAQFDQGIFEQPLRELAAHLAPASEGGVTQFRAGLNRTYRRSRRTMRSLCRSTKPTSKDLYNAVVAAGNQIETWNRLAVNGKKPHVVTSLQSAESAYVQLSSELQSLEIRTAARGLSQRSVLELEEHLRSLLSDVQTLTKLPELIRLRDALMALGMGTLLDEMATRNLGVEQALACFDHVWLSSIQERVTISDRRFGAFDGEAHRRTVELFRTEDRAHVESTAQRVRRAVAENATRVRDLHPRESALVVRQAQLKRGHLPVRRLFEAAPNVLGALKPCWTMSPLVVSQLLPTQRCFDVVIFDEASQVTPADAVGALMRAGQVVVAGDPHQLPPSSFFLASGGGQDDEDAEDAATNDLGDMTLSRNVESLLDVMSALLPRPIGTRTLSWHYRSKDERLIAFSNAQPTLYDWSLTTFPGIAGDVALRHVLVPFRPGVVGHETSVGDEVDRVVELVREHAHSRPRTSLGVIAMGIKHANRIEEALRRARSADELLASFLDGTSGAHEPLFVKNLERVQGDERDAIILSIGYGKSPDGRMLYRFGPINRAGGERRLNVAVTRARAHMTLVSSFSSEDMDPTKLRSEGPQMLRRYLAYMESGGTDLGPVIREKPPLNGFERDVEAQLTAAGIPLVPQYGCSGYWIDFAAQHPTKPGRMILAIEADGATYHSSKTARDRDRLRQDHLERLGWTFHRIWSQDWFAHRDREVERARRAYLDAVADDDGGPPMPSDGPAPGPGPTPAPDDPPPATTRSSPTCPVRTSRQSITDYSPRELMRIVRWIGSDTLLRTEEQLLEETMAVLGFTRKRSRIVASINAAIRAVRNEPAASMATDRQRAHNPGPEQAERSAKIGFWASAASVPYPGLHPDFLYQLRANGILPAGD